MSSKSLKTGAFAQSIFKQSVTQLEELDTIRYGAGGSVYAYSRAGAVALGAAKLTQSAIPLSTSNRETVAANAAVGATSVSITFGTAVTADYYKDGFIYDCVSGGQLYRVKGHAAGTTAVTVYLKDPLRVAWTAATSKATAIQNRQDLVLVMPTTATSAPAGIPPIAVDINYYFWNQVKGPALCLFHTGSGGAAGIGCPVTYANSNTPVAGAVEEAEVNNLMTIVGQVLSVDATTEYGLINLDIPGY